MHIHFTRCLLSGGLISLNRADLLIIIIYFLIVLVIRYYLVRYTKTGDDFFPAGRKMTMWIAGLAFISANLGPAGTDVLGGSVISMRVYKQW